MKYEIVSRSTRKNEKSCHLNSCDCIRLPAGGVYRRKRAELGSCVFAIISEIIDKQQLSIAHQSAHPHACSSVCLSVCVCVCLRACRFMSSITSRSQTMTCNWPPVLLASEYSILSLLLSSVCPRNRTPWWLE